VGDDRIAVRVIGVRFEEIVADCPNEVAVRDPVRVQGARGGNRRGGRMVEFASGGNGAFAVLQAGDPAVEAIRKAIRGVDERAVIVGIGGSGRHQKIVSVVVAANSGGVGTGTSGSGSTCSSEVSSPKVASQVLRYQARSSLTCWTFLMRLILFC